MTVSSVNAKLFTALSALNGRTLSTLSAMNGQSILSNPFGPDPSTIAGLQLWLDAYQITGKSTGDEISTWSDVSGNGRDATGIVANTLKPTYRATDGPNSKPCVRMVRSDNGQGGVFSLPDFLTGLAATSGQAFSVVKIDNDPTSTNQSSSPPLGQWGTNTDEYYPFPGDSGIYDGWGASVRKTTGDPPTSLATWLVYEERTATGAWSRRINAATSGDDLFSTAVNTVAWNAAPYIGHTVTNNKFMHGLIAEIIFYNSVLGSTDYTTIKTYLNTKYGFSLP